MVSHPGWQFGGDAGPAGLPHRGTGRGADPLPQSAASVHFVEQPCVGERLTGDGDLSTVAAAHSPRVRGALHQGHAR